MAFTAIQCREDGTRYPQRYDNETWDMYRPVLEEMFRKGKSRTEMRNVLENEYDFHPSARQLDARMVKWEFSNHATRRTNAATLLVHDAIWAPLVSEENDQAPDLAANNQHEITSASPTAQEEQEGLPQKQEDVALFEEGDLDARDEDEVPCSSSQDVEMSDPPTAIAIEDWSDPFDPGSFGSRTAEQSELMVVDSHNSDAADITTVIAHEVSTSFATSKIADQSYESNSNGSLDQSSNEEICHKQLLIADFLAFLGCYSSSATLYRKVLATTSANKSIAFMNTFWAMFNLVLVDESFRFPDDDQSEWTIAQKELRALLDLGENGQGLWFDQRACLESQFRATNKIEHSFVESTDLNWLLFEEFLQLELKTLILRQLMLWCLLQLSDKDELQRELDNLVNHLHVCSTASDVWALEFARIITCYLLQRWIQEPFSSLLPTMKEHYGKGKYRFDMYVMLPETMATISYMLVEQVTSFDSGLWGNLPDSHHAYYRYRLSSLSVLRESLKTLARERPDMYCRGFVRVLALGRYHGHSICAYSEQRAVHLAQQMMPSATSELVEDVLEVEWLPGPNCLHSHSTANGPSHLEQQTYSTAYVPSRYSSTASRNSFTRLLTTDPPIRTPTTSTGKMSLNSFKELTSRIRAGRLADALGVSRHSSNASRFSLSSDFSFSRVTGLGRTGSTNSDRSFLPVH